MSDRYRVVFRESMASLVDLAPQAPDLPVVDLRARRRPVVSFAVAFVGVFLVVGGSLWLVSQVLGGPVDSATVPVEGSSGVAGLWVSDDLPEGTILRLQIDASGRFESWDEEVVNGLCVGGAVTTIGFGFEEESRFTVSGYTRTCQLSNGTSTFALPDLPFTLIYVYDDASDTLILTADGGCYYRQGTSSTQCP